MGAGEGAPTMKSFLVNLLIVFSILLCGFNAIQWSREAKLHGEMRKLGDQNFKALSEIQQLQQNLKMNQEEIKRVESIRETLASTIKSNRVIISELSEEVQKVNQDLKIQTAKAEMVEQYKQAFEKANENLKRQNEIIQTQNEKMKQLADDRNEMVGRFNKLATDYKSLGDDYGKVLGMYTNLVAQVQAANQKNAK